MWGKAIQISWLWSITGAFGHFIELVHTFQRYFSGLKYHWRLAANYHHRCTFLIIERKSNTWLHIYIYIYNGLLLSIEILGILKFRVYFYNMSLSFCWMSFVFPKEDLPLKSALFSGLKEFVGFENFLLFNFRRLSLRRWSNRWSRPSDKMNKKAIETKKP